MWTELYLYSSSLPSRRVRDDFTFAIYPTTRSKRQRKTTKNFSQDCCNLAEFRSQAHLEYKFIPTSNGCIENMSSPLRSDVAFVWWCQAVSYSARRGLPVTASRPPNGCSFSTYWDGQTQTHEPRDRPCSGGRGAALNITWLVPVLIAWNVLQVQNVYFTAAA